MFPFKESENVEFGGSRISGFDVRVGRSNELHRYLPYSLLPPRGECKTIIEATLKQFIELLNSDGLRAQ